MMETANKNYRRELIKSSVGLFYAGQIDAHQLRSIMAQIKTTVTHIDWSGDSYVDVAMVTSEGFTTEAYCENGHAGISFDEKREVMLKTAGA